jgi:hypothetical protein
MRLSLPSLLFALCLAGGCTPSPQGGGPISDFPADGEQRDAGAGPLMPDPGDSAGGDDGEGTDDGEPSTDLDAGPPPEAGDAGSDAGVDAGSDAGADGGVQDAG